MGTRASSSSRRRSWARAGFIGPSPCCPSCLSSSSFSSVSLMQPARSPTPPSRRRSAWRRSSRSCRGSPIPSSMSSPCSALEATTVFLWFKAYSVAPKFQTPVIISGLVTFIAAYHYMRIFNSWVGAYEYSLGDANPQLTGVPFNDAYRYMDWLLTVPMLLMEIVLVMNLTKEEASQKCLTLGAAAALMIVLGYPGELLIEEKELGTRWFYWALAMLPFLFIIQQLLVGLADATSKESDPAISEKIRMAQIVTVVSWLTYPVVYVFPMFGLGLVSRAMGPSCGRMRSDGVARRPYSERPRPQARQC